MHAISNQRKASSDLPRKHRRSVPLASGTVVLLACLFAAIPNGISLPAANPGDTRASVPLTADDGLTRESLSEFDAPEPPPLAAASAATIDETARPHSTRAIVHHHHRVPPQQPAQNTPQLVVKSAPHRNPVVSFVYWWNGWVINTFHTKVGTVMLGTIGAKT